MPDQTPQIAQLRIRRARAFLAAAELADRIARLGRPFSPYEQEQFRALNAVIDRLDNRLRVLWVQARRGDAAAQPRRPDAGTWARDNDSGSFSALPGSGSRVTVAALRRQ